MQPRYPGAMALSPEDEERMQRGILHAAQVQDGLIPEDSPDDFTVPQPADSRGLPWFFGPDYKPTPEALAEFTGPMTDDDEQGTLPL